MSTTVQPRGCAGAGIARHVGKGIFLREQPELITHCGRDAGIGQQAIPDS